MADRKETVLRYFNENRQYMDERVKDGIEKNRKGLATLRFTDSSGNPVTGVHIEAVQKTHAFKYGANIFMLDEMESREKNEAYKELFKDAFNLATIPFYWCDLEPEQGKPRFTKDSPRLYRRPAPDLCLEFCRSSGIEPKLHCLNYDQWTPRWVPQDKSEVKRLLDKRFGEIAGRYAGVIPSYEVTNETFCPRLDTPQRKSTPFFDDPEIIEWSFDCARRHFPGNKLIINEATDFVWGREIWDGVRETPNNRNGYYMQIERALRKGAPIDSIGMQYHMFKRAEEEEKHIVPFYDPRRLYDTMDLFSDFGLPLQMTELTIPAFSDSDEDEELQAEIIRNLYSIWFSHPNMEAIIYWNLVDGYAAFAPQGDMTAGENYFRGALAHFDLTPKPAYFVIRDLFSKVWRTNESISSKADNSASFRGFYGDYELTVTAKGNTIKQNITLAKNKNNEFAFTI